MVHVVCGTGHSRELYGMIPSDSSEYLLGNNSYLSGIPSSYQPEVSLERLCAHKICPSGGKYILTREIRRLGGVHTLYAVRKTSSKYWGISCLSTDGGDLSTAAVDNVAAARVTAGV
jgi:hypothetical protein